MSAGNIKTQGDKGTNFRYQLGVLQLLKQSGLKLEEISAALGGSAGTVAPKVINATTDGTTPANAKSVSLYFSGDNGTFDGEIIPNGLTLNYSPTAIGDTVAQTAYTVPTSVGGYVLITYII